MKFYKLVLIQFIVDYWFECRPGNARVAKVLFYSMSLCGDAGLLVDLQMT